MNEINNTVPTAIKYEPPAEKWGQVLHCKDCRFSIFSSPVSHGAVYVGFHCKKKGCPCYNERVPATFGCVLGEPE